MTIISKNIRVISRSKLSTSLILLAPILIVFLVGTAFSSDSLHNLKLGVYSGSYNELSETIISDLGSKQFVSEKLNSEEECVNAVKEAAIHACVIFPGDLSVSGNSESIVIYADNSRINLAYTIINEINLRISVKGSELGVVMAQSLLDAIQEARLALPLSKTEVDSSISNVDNIYSRSKGVYVDVSSIQSSINSSLSEIEDTLGDNSSSALDADIASVRAKLAELGDVKNDVGVINATSKETSEKLASVSESLDVLIDRIATISVSNAQDIVLPIKTEIKPVTKDSTNWKYLFPTLVALITLLSSMVLSSSMVFAERKAKSHFRNFMTPTSDFSFVLGTYVTCLLVIGLQLLVLFSGTVYLTSISISGVVGQLLLVLFLAASSFIFIGMIVGYIFKSDETTVLASISISSLLIFFSNVILPTEIINSSLKYLAIYNPFYLTDVLLRKVILFGSPLASLSEQIFILVGSIVVLFVFTVISRKMTKRSL